MKDQTTTQSGITSPLKVITATELCALLKIGKGTLYSLVRGGRIRPLKGFRRYRFSLAEVERFVLTIREA
ncbi:MAG: helix-turn-helix domain-containing protein [Sphingomonadales bacterium]|nr:helix-turn-helix domain-containing protein [Sphingomonadales bacterium]